MSEGLEASTSPTPPSLHSSEHKSPTAFRTISEVAEGLNLPQHVLRFWESKFQQIALKIIRFNCATVGGPKPVFDKTADMADSDQL